MHEILSRIPSALQAKISGGAVRFQCPRCNRPNKAFTRDGAWWKCNAANTCGKSGSVAALSGQKPSAFKPVEQRKQTNERRFRFSDFNGWKCNLSDSQLEWIESRFGNIAPKVVGLIDSKFLTQTSRLKDSWALRMKQKGYELLIPLFRLADDAMISAQIRYTKPGPPPKKKSKNPLEPPEDMAKSYSIYGRSLGNGACFGKLQEALKAAKNRGRIVLCEGVPDWLSLKALGLNVVGVPGVNQAPKVMRQLVKDTDPDASFEVVLALDGDKAGTTETKKCLSILRQRPHLRVRVVELGETEDVNDVLLAVGPQAVVDMISGAQIYQDGYADSEKLKALAILDEFDRETKKLKALQLWSFRKHNRQRKFMAAAIYLIASWEESGEKAKIARASWLRKIINSGSFVAIGVARDSSGAFKQCSRRYLHSQSPYSAKAAADLWNYAYVPWLLENMDDVDYSVASFAFTTRAQAKELRATFKRFFGPKVVKNLLSLVDPERRVIHFVSDQDLSFAATFKAYRGFEWHECAEGGVRRLSRNEMIAGVLKPAWFGAADYLESALCESVIDESDPWLASQFKRIHGRDCWGFPGEKYLREEMSARFEELGKAHQAVDESTPVEPEFNVTYHAETKRILTVTIRPDSYANAVRRYQGLRANYPPLTDGNLLRDSFWTEMIEQLADDLGLDAPTLEEQDQNLEPLPHETDHIPLVSLPYD